MTDMEKKLKQAMDEFDWGKVHKVMEFRNWKWFLNSGEKVPSIEEMKNCVYKLGIECLKHPTNEIDISTGGFIVRKFEYNGEIGFEIKFVLEYSWVI